MMKRYYKTVVNITPGYTTIYDSYKIEKRKEMKRMLSAIKNDVQKWLPNRSIQSMVDEWCTHNLLYNLHILRKRTGNVDLNNNQKWIFKAGYWILSKFYWK